VHIVDLSTAIVKVDIKVITVSLTQNQSLQCVTPPLTNVEIPRPRDATELNNDGISAAVKIPYHFYATQYKTRSSATAEKQRVSCPHEGGLSPPAHSGLPTPPLPPMATPMRMVESETRNKRTSRVPSTKRTLR